jgi:trk system potassium uptake protein TrkH
MLDFRPVGYVIGLVVVALGASMLLPMALDLAQDNGHWGIFAESAILTMVCGAVLALACRNGVQAGLSIQQTFLLTTGVWFVLPMFGCLPFILGATGASLVDGFFEAMSGLTTTGSTVFSGLDDLPQGILLWRSMLQWFGGVGIIVVAMVFLPELRVGGMQIFRSESFDTDGKVLPQAAQIAQRISVVYVLLTLACFLSYSAVGMTGLDAMHHSLTTIATGGFSSHDASFGAFKGTPEYVAVVFMILASLPFIRYVQMLAGQHSPLFRDTQVRTFLWLLVAIVVAMTFRQVVVMGDGVETAFREVIFNITSIMSGTGYASTDYQLWGGFSVVVFFFIGFIGGCAGSTTCSIKVFRFQLLFASIKSMIRTIHSPSGVFTPRYEGRPVPEEVMSSVMAFFGLFVVSVGLLAVLLGMTGLDFVTAVSGAATAMANVGPGLGQIIGPSGNFGELNDTAKWLLSAGLLIGRLELMSVYAILTLNFWRA